MITGRFKVGRLKEVQLYFCFNLANSCCCYYAPACVVDTFTLSRIQSRFVSTTLNATFHAYRLSTQLPLPRS